MADATKYDFRGKHAVVTGGAAGIGRAIAQRLLGDGAKVTVFDLDMAALESSCAELGDNAHGVQVDVSDEASVMAAVRQAQAFGANIDILVNSAGITGPNTTVIEYPTEHWNRVFEINTRGTFLMCKHVAAVMMQASDGQGKGQIVNIASIAGKEGNPNASAYSASKAAVISLTKSLGKELCQTGIRVNCITPAAVKTGMFEQMTQQHIDFMLSKIPMNRFGTVQEIANLVAWLASDECSFSTGAVFDISGGRATY
jgi:3-oxoacyl-[acyl-carrier protein] reductase